MGLHRFRSSEPVGFQAALLALPLFVSSKEQGGCCSQGGKFDGRQSLCEQRVSSES